MLLYRGEKKEQPGTVHPFMLMQTAQLIQHTYGTRFKFLLLCNHKELFVFRDFVHLAGISRPVRQKGLKRKKKIHSGVKMYVSLMLTQQSRT